MIFNRRRSSAVVPCSFMSRARSATARLRLSRLPSVGGSSDRFIDETKACIYKSKHDGRWSSAAVALKVTLLRLARRLSRILRFPRQSPADKCGPVVLVQLYRLGCNSRVCPQDRHQARALTSHLLHVTMRSGGGAFVLLNPLLPVACPVRLSGLA